jgi:copper resistance protein B
MRLAKGALLTLLLTAWPGSTFAQHGSHPAVAPQPSPDPAAAPAAGEHGHAIPPGTPAGQAPAEAPSTPVLPSFIPSLTDADRAAAFPDVKGHAVHDQALNSYVLFDRLEWQAGSGSGSVAVDSKGWIGTDIDRFWFRAEGDGDAAEVGRAQADLLYGRAMSPWWSLVAGARQDFRPGAAQTWAAVGIQGLAPYWFEVEATAYFGAAGRTRFRARTEYELLLTNRLIVQPSMEVELSGKADLARGVGAGLSSAELGLRVRYEIRRELAPYIGITWDRNFFSTADYAAAAGERSGARVAVGLRLWR